MCGIVAIFSRQAPVAADVLERATKSLRHRGPDGQRYWIAIATLSRSSWVIR